MRRFLRALIFDRGAVAGGDLRAVILTRHGKSFCSGVSLAEALAAQIAKLAPMAVQGMKQTLVELSQNRLDEAAAK